MSGQSKRARANRRRMQREYTDHWEDRLPRAEKPESYKKLGLPLVLAPFVLMFCGGCVATAPTASILIAALAGLMWFGDVVIAATKTTRYWVVYRNRALWKVGENKEEAQLRDISVTAAVDQYPDDYAGRIQCLLPATEQRPSWAYDRHSAELMDLTTAQMQQCWGRGLKVINEKLVRVSLDDRLGAITAALREEFDEAAIEEAVTNDNTEAYDIRRRIVEHTQLLPETITHTGTGLYRVKKTPVNETEEQSGAVAGQVVTIVGTVAASPAFTGGYISNTTQAQVRAIVSHDTTTATLDGVISGWGTGDVLEWYDSWSTIDAAAEQLLVDQGVSDFDIEQAIEIEDGTYTEIVAVSGLSPTAACRLVVRAATGETAVILTNSGLGSSAMDFDSAENAVYRDFQITSAVDEGYALVAYGGSAILNMDIAGTCYGVQHFSGYGDCNNLWAKNCTFTGTIGMRMYGVAENCTFTGCTDALVMELFGAFGGGASWVAGCVFDGCTNCVDYKYDQDFPASAGGFSSAFYNCTVYNCTQVMNAGTLNDLATCLRVVAWNNIFHTCTTVWQFDIAASVFGRGHCDYNTYYNCTNIAEIDSTNYTTLGGWQALTDFYGASPDPNSVVTDPGITAPATDDWSLGAASNCRHAGVGSYVLIQQGINAVAFDKWHPDKGAWSSGPGPNVAYAG